MILTIWKAKSKESHLVVYIKLLGMTCWNQDWPIQRWYISLPLSHSRAHTHTHKRGLDAQGSCSELFWFSTFSSNLRIEISCHNYCQVDSSIYPFFFEVWLSRNFITFLCFSFKCYNITSFFPWHSVTYLQFVNLLTLFPIKFSANLRDIKCQRTIRSINSCLKCQAKM